MDAIKQQMLRIQQQLVGLSASQKMLTASLVVIMIMTMFYWSHYASSSEMDVLLDQAMSADEITQIKTALSAKNVKYDVTGDRIMVPSDKKFEILAELGYDQLLPRDMKSGFDDIIAQMSPLDPSAKTEQFFNHAKEKELSSLIGRWPGVKSAFVIIDGTHKLSPVRSIQPTASVDITLKPNETPGKKLAEAACDMLCGAQSGLERGNVRITVNGRPLKLGDPSDPFGSEDNAILEAKTKFETWCVNKILGQIPIDGVRATVSSELKTQSSILTSHTVDPKGKVEGLESQTNTSTENTPVAPPQGEPGVAANVGVQPDQGGGGGGMASTMEKTEIKNKVDLSYKNQETKDPAGEATATAASVLVPDSYFRRLWKMKHPTSTNDPTDADLEPLIQAQIPIIRGAAKTAAGIKDDAAVLVSTYADIDAPMSPSETATAGLASLPVSVGFGAKDIAVGALAVISLFMVSMMVRKSAPQPLLASIPVGGEMSEQSSTPGPGTLAVSNNITGEVREAGSMLVGHELSEEAIEANQVIEQVGTMVKENPEVAANLVKRWLNRE